MVLKESGRFKNKLLPDGKVPPEWSVNVKGKDVKTLHEQEKCET